MIGGTRKSCGCPLGCCCIHGTDRMDDSPISDLALAGLNEGWSAFANQTGRESMGNPKPVNCARCGRTDNCMWRIRNNEVLCPKCYNVAEEHGAIGSAIYQDVIEYPSEVRELADKIAKETVLHIGVHVKWLTKEVHEKILKDAIAKAIVESRPSVSEIALFLNNKADEIEESCVGKSIHEPEWSNMQAARYLRSSAIQIVSRDSRYLELISRKKK